MFYKPFSKTQSLEPFPRMYLPVFIFQHVYNACNGYTVDLGRCFCLMFGAILNLILFFMPFLVTERRLREGEGFFS